MHKKILSLLVIMGMVLPAHAAGALRVDIGDSIAGLEADASLSSFPASAPVELHLTTPAGDDIALTGRTGADGSAHIAIPATLVEQSGTYQAAASISGNVQAETTFQVLPDRPDPAASVMNAQSKTVATDGRTQTIVTVTIADRFENPLPGRPVQLTSSRNKDTITPLTQNTDATGTQRFALTTKQTGPIVLAAMDLLSNTTLSQRLTLQAGSASETLGRGSDAPYSGNPLVAQVSGGNGPADSFVVTVDPSDAKVNDVLDLTVEAVDADGNTALDYVGNPEIRSPDDLNSVLPGLGDGGVGTLTFSPKNQGKKKFPLSVSFSKAGSQRLIVRDASDPNNVIEGQITVTVTGSSQQQSTLKIEILSHKDGGKINDTKILLEGIGPKLANLIVTGGKNDVVADTDNQGHFSVPVELDAQMSEYALRVRSQDDGSGGADYDSGVIHLFRDTVGPEVQFEFSPKNPEEGTDVGLTVTTEPGLQDVTMDLQSQELSLAEDQKKPGVYRLVFRAPAAGEYQPEIKVTDSAGNLTDIRGTLTVTPQPVNPPLNLRAEPTNDGVDLFWDPVTDKGVTSYVIYVGTGASFTSSLDTKGIGTSRSVKGLRRNAIYSFAVSAKRGDQESGKSNVIQASVLGLNLTVTPQENKLLLQWSYANKDKVPLKSYLLEYGTAHADGKPLYTEKRELSGDMEAYIINDLIGGVTYDIRLTPKTTTEEFILELSITTQATPLRTGEFKPTDDGSSTVTPVNDDTVPPDNGLHDGAPDVSHSGLPLGAIGGVLGVSALFLFWRMRRRKMVMTQEFLKQMQRQYRQ